MNKQIRRSALDTNKFFATIDNLIEDATRSGKSAVVFCRDKVMFALIYFCGLRIGEVLLLKVSDYISADCDGIPTIRICNLTKCRYVPIFEPSISQLIEWYLTHIRPAFVTNEESTVLFLNSKGECMLPMTLEDRFAYIIQQSGLSNHHHINELRHIGIARLVTLTTVPKVGHISSYRHSPATTAVYVPGMMQIRSRKQLNKMNVSVAAQQKPDGKRE
jgi:site-specific recombinase XerD